MLFRESFIKVLMILHTLSLHFSKDQSIKLWDLRCFSSKNAVDATKLAVKNQNWDYRWQGVPRKSKSLNIK